MMFNALSSLHLITVINKHGGTSSYKVNWDKSELLSNCKYCIPAARYYGFVVKVKSILHCTHPFSFFCGPIDLNAIRYDYSVHRDIARGFCFLGQDCWSSSCRVIPNTPLHLKLFDKLDITRNNPCKFNTICRNFYEKVQACY